MLAITFRAGWSHVRHLRSALTVLAHRVTLALFAREVLPTAYICQALARMRVADLAGRALPETLLGIHVRNRSANYKRAVARSNDILLPEHMEDRFAPAECYPTPAEFRCEAVPTEHCADTVEWRKALVQAARHNVIVSGNYCGDASFDAFLDCVEESLSGRPGLRVLILSSPAFLKDGGGARNITKIRRLQQAYAHRFSLVLTPGVWILSPYLKRITNHTKCTVIDYGKYFMLGGSGIKDNFADAGILDHLEEDLPDVRVGAARAPDRSADRRQAALNLFMPPSFRDMDFVFHSTTGPGSVVYRSMLLLSRRWEVYNRNLAPLPVRHSCHSIAERETPLEESLTSRLIDELASPLVDLTTTVPRFASSKRRARDVAVTILTTGPEARAESAFEREILRRVREARRRILVNQMYFHPTRRILEALTEAARRGVPVTVITNGTHGNDRRSCPHSHFFFAQRSKYNWARLIRRVPAAWRERVQVFEFEQRQKGNHKKVMIIDDHVLGGSGNLGYKSLVTMSDHEINFRATSPRLAEETARIFEQDIGCSREVTAETRLTLNEYFKTATHRMLAPLYG